MRREALPGRKGMHIQRSNFLGGKIPREEASSMKKGLPEAGKCRKTDLTILSEYEGMLRIIRSCALLDSRLVRAEGDSFSVETDIVIDDFLSLEGVFAPSFVIRQSSSTLKILKDSFCDENLKDVSGKISTEMRHTIMIENEGSEEGEGMPLTIECALFSETTYVEKKEASLLSRQRKYLEKSFAHTATITKTPGSKRHDVGKSSTTRGFVRIDAASGHVMEESNE
jgi:hypothetical protein